MSENMKLWDAVRRPPKEALKTISGGRLSGMTDISPMWRMKVLTEHFGPCGTGWHYEIVRAWTADGVDGTVMAFAEINLYAGGRAIPGIGGSMLVAQEKGGLRPNDEAFKMAVTDAISVASKALGIAADIYAGLWDGSKYRDEAPEKPEPKQASPELIADLEDAAKRGLEAFRTTWKALTKDERESVSESELKRLKALTDAPGKQ